MEDSKDEERKEELFKRECRVRDIGKAKAGDKKEW